MTMMTVADRRVIAADVVELTLTRVDGEPVPAWDPGSHLELTLPAGVIRQYSVCGDRTDRTRLTIAVLREANGRGGSRDLWDNVGVGQQVAVEGPRNHFTLRPASEYLFIAGGIGITPIIAMMREARRIGAPMKLWYGGRSRSSMAYASELGAEYGADIVLVPEDEHGLIDLEAILAEPRSDCLVYACGPESLLTAIAGNMARWPTDALSVERFVQEKATAEDLRGDSFVIVCNDGRHVQVPSGTSALAALRNEGLKLKSSCEGGNCGTCEVRVLEGLPDHRDDVLSDEEHAENDAMMICVSRSLTPELRLDV
jgi:ferredoxin-NADP reductase